MKILVVFDDTVKKNDVITDIIGNKGFADVVVKNKTLEEYYRNIVNKLYPEATWRKVTSIFEYAGLAQDLSNRNEEIRILHCFSNYRIIDEKKALLSLEKLKYIEEPFKAVFNNLGGVLSTAALLFNDAASYVSFCRSIEISTSEAIENIKESFEIAGFIDIGIVSNFIHCITGTLDARYFNSLKGNEYTLVKSSTNIEKIKSEYQFYHLLPEDMRMWFVMPFNYKENADIASYTMERFHIADLAIKWVHGSLDTDEFDKLMNKYFFFILNRHSKNVSKEDYLMEAKKLYVDKVFKRIKQLKTLEQYKIIKKVLNAFSNYNDAADYLDYLVEKYLKLKDKIEEKNHYQLIHVIGHGDLCFANTLYNKSTQILKLIDPKGALSEKELWTNPYYDLAKLSHSICGKYDFFNHDMFNFRVDKNFSLVLEIPFDNSKYVRIFREKVENNGFDYLSIRIYEASLFLSMLPLHIDNPYKVLGFIINADNILKEIEKDVV